MRPHRARILTALLALAPTAALHAQATAPPAAAWRADPPRIAAMDGVAADSPRPLPALPVDSAGTRGHTVTGLAIGGLLGLGAAGLFIAGFCNDGDDQCSSGDVGKIITVIALPPAALGALIGTLVRTHR